MKKSNKISVFLSFVLILLLAIGAASAADDAIMTDDANLAAVDEVQAVDNTHTSDEIYAESTDIVVADTGDSGDSDVISDGTGLQEISDNGDEGAVVSDNVNPKNVLKAEIDSDEPLRAEPDGTFSDLYDFLRESVSSGTANLNRNYVYNPATDSNYQNGFSISNNFTINGNGYTIDGGGVVTRFFNLQGYTSGTTWSTTYNGYTYNFNDINFQNFYRSGTTIGGVIVSQEYPNIITISNCNFTNNRGYRGPAVYVSVTTNRVGNTGNVTITGCVFKNNSASNSGGAIYSGISSGNSKLTINNNVFVNNTASGSGQAIYYVNNYAPDVNYNWWGQNGWSNGFVANSGTRYIIPQYSYQAALTQKDDTTVELTLVLNGSSAPSGSTLPLRDATFSISSGTIDPESGSVTYGSPLDATFSITEPVTITATVDNQPLTINIDRVPITVTSTDVTVTYPGTGSVAITASIAGTYSVKVGDTTYPVTVTENGGTASVNIPLSNVGEYGISVTADLGNPYIPVDTGIINYYKVIAGSITVTGQGTTVTYPEKGTIVVNTDVAGAYTITVGDNTYDATLVAGDNDFNIPDVFDADTYDVKVSANIANYNPITEQSIATYTVEKADSSVSVDSISFTYGESGSATATLDGATGLNAVIDGFADAVSVSGSVITVSGLPAGDYTMVVTTVPDANHNAVSINVDVTVAKATPVVSLSADSEEIIYGDSVTLTGGVVPSDAGAVTYWVNGSEVNSNVLSGLGAGTYTV
ncbi:hypothetical protein, partial [Methanobrevibacter sp.]|uniref:hypothetical protein n=1 Tax=Methanobrevibacter sp. TaxID=66852 RepID=UPI0025D0D980